MTKENEVANVANVGYDVALAKEMGFDFTKNFEGGAEARLPVLNSKSEFEPFEGIILHYQRINVWWEKSYDETGGGAPADCASNNGRKPTQGENQQHDSCATCKCNQWGSDPKGTGGKWCQNKVRVHIMREGKLLPTRLVVSAGSLKNFDEYMTEITNDSLPYQIVKTKFSTGKATNRKGLKYDTLVFERGEIVPKEEWENIKTLCDKFHAQFTDEIQSDEHDEARPADDVDYE